MSINSSNETVSDALLDVRQNQNSLLELKRFGVLMVIITLSCSILLPYTISFAIASSVLAAITIVYPQILAPISGLLSPPMSALLNLVLAILFYTIFAPAAWIYRKLSVDIIQQKLEPEAQSYWNKRTDVSQGKYMTNQR